jgi:hypothetical protein
VSLAVVANRQLHKKKILEHDKAGYYLYLPATIIYKDIQHLEFYPRILETYETGGGNDYGISPLPNGNKIDKYPAGSALFELPFFLAAHLYCTITRTYPADGYSVPYNMAVIVSAVFWIFFGLLLIRKVLRKYFSDGITALVLLCLSLGTNLYYYAAFEPGMSHPYSFFLFSLLLYCCDNLHSDGKDKYMYVIGAALGLAVITRPVNIIAVIIPLLWNVDGRAAFLDKMKRLSMKWKQVLIAGGIFTAIVLIQLSYWKYVTGSWIFYSYGNEGFDLAHSKVLDGLFSYRKGWFIYTPVAFVAFAGLFFTKRKMLPALMIFFAAIIFVTFSWKNWYYGGSFGCRPLIDVLPLLAIPLGNITQAAFKTRIKYVYVVLLFGLIGLNSFQSYQYSKSIIHWDRMTGAAYWHVFGKANVEDKTEGLMDEQEYYDEMKSWEE